MKTVGAFQAKTQLSQLLDEVEKGETVTIRIKDLIHEGHKY